MEIEYELPVAGSSSTIQPALLNHAAPARVDSDEEEGDDVEGDGVEGEGEEEGDGDENGDEEEDEEDEEPEEEVEETSAAQKPAKKFPKQRQSLAEKQPGTTIFPISRIKRIVRADKELDSMTSEATFLVAVATHFMEEGYTKARLDKRKIVNYRDMVARSPEFDFLRESKLTADVIPAPMAMSEALELRKRKNENPTLHEDTPASAQEISENLPPLIPSTNPLFPNAVVKKPPNTHAKVAQGRAGGKKEKEEKTTSVATPAKANGKASNSTPHTLSTRKSARRNTISNDAPDFEMDAEAPQGAEVEQSEEVRPSSEAQSDRMDED